MAQRRMLAKAGIDSDAFTDMPLSAQGLYMHLVVNADDDGFLNSPRRIQRSVGASDDDLRILVTKGFVIVFESGVVAIAHWLMQNSIRKDRYTPTSCIDEFEMVDIDTNGVYQLLEPEEEKPLVTTNIESANNQVATRWQPLVATGKDRLDEVSSDEVSEGKPALDVGVQNIENPVQISEDELLPDEETAIVEEVVRYLNEKSGKSFNTGSKLTNRLICKGLKDGFKLDDFKHVIDVKCAAWKDDPRMDQYLRPETLFGPKFENYRNEKVVIEDDYSEYNV